MGRKGRNCPAGLQIKDYIGGLLVTKATKLDVEEWNQLPWKIFADRVYKLQCRIYEAAKSNDEQKVYGLQRLLLSSKAARYLAVRQVTQLNPSKKTDVIDGIRILNPKNRIVLAEELRTIKDWKHSKLRVEYITKPDETQVILGIPRIKDIAAYCLVNYSLEPVYEAEASNGSYSFRPGRSAYDIQKKIFMQLRAISKTDKTQILRINIENCLDKLDYEKILNFIKIHKPFKPFLRSVLKVGILNKKNKILEGTAKGKIFYPLLVNIAVNGVEDLLNENRGTDKEIQNGLRYANDILFFLKEEIDLIKLKIEINQFLDNRGLDASEAKIKLVKVTDGFDFLGWRFKVAKHRVLIYPSKDSFKNMVSKIKYTMKNSKYDITVRLEKIKVIYRDWFIYHRYCNLSEINLWSIKKWTCTYLKTNTKMSSIEADYNCIKIFSRQKYALNGYIAVSEQKSVYDGDLRYWSKRNDFRFDGLLAIKLKSQDYKCNYCQLYFLPDDLVDLHYLDGNKKNFLSNNLEVLHRTCHHYKLLHFMKSKQGFTTQ
ncbi:MAG: hypothetical protein RL284_1336 [Bacteroidota bacterium]